MKTKFFLIMTVTLLITQVGCNRSRLADDQVPLEISRFVSNNFSNRTIKKVIREEHDAIYSYKVTLSDDTKLKFDSNRNVIEIESKSKIPNSVLQQDIVSYVNFNHSGHYIKKWEVDKGYQKVKLDNQKHLEFDRSGHYLKD